MSLLKLNFTSIKSPPILQAGSVDN